MTAVYFKIFQKSLDAMAIIEDEKLVECNEAMVDLLGYTSKEPLLQLDYSELSPVCQPNGEKSKNIIRKHIKFSQEQGTYTYEFLHLHENKKAFWAEVTLTNIATEKNNYILLMLKDITNIRNEEQKYIGDYGTVFKYAKTGFAIIDDKTKFLDANSTYLNMLGYEKSELLRYHGLEVSAEKDVESSMKTVNRVMKDGYIENFEKVYIKKDGTPINVEMSLALLPDEKRVLISVRDITENKRIEKALKDSKEILRIQAHYDTLTGLPNRAFFQDKLAEAIDKAKINQEKFAMLFLDIDNFKTVNDTFGHQTGDLFLVRVAKKISSVLEKKDTFSRIGGDEFTIILNDIKESSEVVKVVKEIFTVLKDDIMINNHVLNAYMSVGITICPNDAICSEQIMINSDVAMHYVKENGKNNFAFYNDEMNQEILNIIQIENELIDALKNREFIVYYQPQINASKGSLIGLEALVRWHHPTKGLIAPHGFLAIAEKTGLLPAIDNYVMREAMKQIHIWYDKGYEPGKMSLNLPIKQIEKEGCISRLESILEETNCLPQWVEFEITENDLMIDPDNALQTLVSLRKLGIDLAIDDFGIGYSSLSYLKKFPITKLKIDQSFIKDLPHDDEDKAISRAIIALATSLNINIIAEGVETEAQKKFLLENNCINIQGYLYSKPINAQELEERFLKK